MTAFVLVVLVTAYALASTYTPPAESYRLWPDLSPSTATILALVGVNTLVCAAWRFYPLWPLLTRFFMHVPGYPRAVQSVLNLFSHVQYEHLFGNMFMLALVGPACHELVGRGIFLGTYIAGGAVGTLASLYWANLGRGSLVAHSVGASAAIWAVAVLYCLLTDRETISLPFVKDKEVGFWPRGLIAAFIVWEVLMARKKGAASPMDHASHFGGMVVGGGVAGWLYVRGFHQRRRAQETGDPVGAVVEEVKEVKGAVEKAVKGA